LKVVAMGDSTTAGTPGFESPVEAPPVGRGDEKSQYAYWVRMKHPEWVVLNKGVNGERTDEILRRFGRDVLDEDPEVVVVLAGVNDIYQGVPVDEIKGNLVSMYSRAKEAGIGTVGCSVLPYDTMTAVQAEKRRLLNRWISEECRLEGMVFCDTAASVSSPDDLDRLAGTPDGLHPGVLGYRRMGEKVCEAIEALGR
jgi:acyl-CoA thioesterase I